MDKKFRVGLFVLAAAGLLSVGIIKLGDVTFERTYTVYVYFDDIAGMAEKSPVKIAGVEVGKVKAVTLEQGKACARLSISRGVTLYRDARARVTSTSIIGTKYLDLSPGSPSQEPLKDGDAFTGISVLGMEESIAKALESVKGLTESVRGPRDDLGRNLNAMVANLNAVTVSFKEIMDDRKMDISASLLAVRHITAGLAEILDKADRILARVEKGEGAAGAILTDAKVGEDIKASSAHLREASGGAAEMFGRFNRFRAFWDYRYRYDADASQGRSDFGMKLSPRPTRYYFAGVSNLGDKSTSVKEKDFEKKNTFNIGMGKEFFPWLDLYAGIIRSEGGFGARIKPFAYVPYADRLTLEAEAYAFGRDTTFNNKRLRGANYNLGISAEVFPWLRLVGRGEDLNQTKHFQGGMNIAFEDKDIAYLLGLITATR